MQAHHVAVHDPEGAPIPDSISAWEFRALTALAAIWATFSETHLEAITWSPRPPSPVGPYPCEGVSVRCPATIDPEALITDLKTQDDTRAFMGRRARVVHMLRKAPRRR